MSEQYMLVAYGSDDYWRIIDTHKLEVVAQQIRYPLGERIIKLLNSDAVNQADDEDRKAMQAARDAHPGDMAAARAAYRHHVLTKTTKGEG